jgi:hypothetical protein
VYRQHLILDEDVRERLELLLFVLLGRSRTTTTIKMTMARSRIMMILHHNP